MGIRHGSKFGMGWLQPAMNSSPGAKWKARSGPQEKFLFFGGVWENGGTKIIMMLAWIVVDFFSTMSFIGNSRAYL